MVIDIGTDVVNRPSVTASGYTNIIFDNPANASGTLTTFSAWAATDITGAKVGIFYLVSGQTYKCRSAATIGNITAGSKQDFEVSLAVETGDFIALYFSGGSIERTDSGGKSNSQSGDYCTVGVEHDFSVSGRIWSFGATGEEVSVGWSHTIYGVIPSKINGVATTDIVKVNGIS